MNVDNFGAGLFFKYVKDSAEFSSSKAEQQRYNDAMNRVFTTDDYGRMYLIREYGKALDREIRAQRKNKVKKRADIPKLVDSLQGE